jgi:phosphogluconate dehydratase
VEDGDIIRLCGHDGLLEVKADLSTRTAATQPAVEDGLGRELFAIMRAGADGAERGGSAMLVAAGL